MFLEEVNRMFRNREEDMDTFTCSHRMQHATPKENFPYVSIYIGKLGKC